jgi:formaldehyde-activating enzyme involved in methanogenesis
VLDAVAAELIPCTRDLIVFVAVYIDPSARDETAVRVASRTATLKGVRTARHGPTGEASQTLVERRDTLRSPFYGGS